MTEHQHDADASAARTRRIHKAISEALARGGAARNPSANDYMRAIAAGLEVVVDEIGERRPAPAVPQVPAFVPPPGSVWLGLPGGSAVRLDEGDDETLLRTLPGAEDAFGALERLARARERILRAPLGGRPQMVHEQMPDGVPRCGASGPLQSVAGRDGVSCGACVRLAEQGAWQRA